jgi:hypothetical protein
MNALARLATVAALAGIASSTPVFAQQSAQQSAHRLGDHPAVIVKRQWAKKGYDYESKFYPHPAWLYWYNEAPRPVTDYPTSFAADRERQDAAAAPETRRVSIPTR